MIIMVTRNGPTKRRCLVKAIATPMELKAHMAWTAAINRCKNPGCTHYKHYGGRGIKVCDRWQERFEDFVADVGLPPSEEYWIERINNDGNYEPGNVKWALKAEQFLNRSNNRVITIGGVSKPISVFAKEAGITLGCLFKRIEYGIKDEDLLKPVGSIKSKHEHSVTINGETKNATEWARIVGISLVGFLARMGKTEDPAILLKPNAKSKSSKHAHQ